MTIWGPRDQVLPIGGRDFSQMTTVPTVHYPRFISALLFKRDIHSFPAWPPPTITQLRQPANPPLVQPTRCLPCSCPPHLIHQQPVLRFSLQTHPNLTITTSCGLFLFLPPGSLAEASGKACPVCQPPCPSCLQACQPLPITVPRASGPHHYA